jgi:hypothetical protein
VALERFIERKHRRYFVHKHINYKYNNTPDVPDDRIFQGITIDTSTSGMGIYVYHMLAVGDQLKISTDMYSEPHQKVTVKWINKIDDEIFRVGLMFAPKE